MLITLLFWLSVLFVWYAYVGYPLLLWCLGTVRKQVVRKGLIQPSVAFIITAYNEEKRIRGKIENTLMQDYPNDRLDIVIASDCSTDRTDPIVQSFQPSGVRLVRLPHKGGKEAAWRFIDATRVISITTNLGDTKTTIAHPATTSHGRLSPQERASAGIRDNLVRVAVGLEDVADLKADLARGLAAL